MNIVLICSEVEPFAKSGGLADVCSALPVELHNLGHSISVFMPAYATIQKGDFDVRPTNVRLAIPVGSTIKTGGLLEGRIHGTDVPIYFVKQAEYFDREGLYGHNGTDFGDNCQRFVFFCRAVIESIISLGLPVDLVHCNDWHTGLVPALLKTEHRRSKILQDVGSLMTIHNLAYQGIFPEAQMEQTGLDWKHFNWKEMEYYGQLNLLKSGIVFADAINTVSPTYAREIQTEELGCGLHSLLQHRRDRLSGILNGIDTKIWNPTTDPHIPRNYDSENWQVGKAICKSELQSQLKLEIRPDVPLIGIVGRLVTQKGWPMILEVMQHALKNDNTQWAVLGAGQREFHEALNDLSRRFPGRLATRLTFSNPLAHQIEAGADIFLMPSQFEPCGLNQMYSQAYGTIPVVHRTGGLADTVVDASQENIQKQMANGVSFEHYTVDELNDALRRAIDMFVQHPKIWNQLVVAGMNADRSWTNSARKYVALYKQSIEYHNTRQ